jgi:hypothetical protein
MRGDRGSGQVATGISLPAALLSQAKARAQSLDMPLSQYIRRLIHDDLNSMSPMRMSGPGLVAESAVPYGAKRNPKKFCDELPESNR